MAQRKAQHYWRSWEEGPGASEFVQISRDEFAESLDRPTEQFSRRSFLKAAGFTATVTALAAGCSHAPVEKAIPYLIQPEEIVPGVSYFYATTCGGCSAACGVLAKNRDGRPIKLEGNPEHPLSRGGLCVVGQASLLNLYDSHRLKGPLREGQESTWAEADAHIRAQLETIRASRGAVRVLSGTVSSPTLRAQIQTFLASFRDARHIVYDALSSSAIADAHQATHGERRVPHFRFDKADVIVSFDADFLGTWISPVEFTRDYASGRRLDTLPPRMSHHTQVESRLSLTGAKADQRIRVSPAENAAWIESLAACLAKTAGAALPVALNGEVGPHNSIIEQLARRLWQARGRCLVVCGSQEPRAQILVNLINHLLGNYGTTLDWNAPSQQKAGNDCELEALSEELDRGRVAALFLLHVNPVYELPNGPAFRAALGRVPLVVNFADRWEETSSLSRFLCPDHNPLESWGDAEAVRGVYGLCQPAIRPLGNTRSVLESFAAWSGDTRSAYELVRAHWRENIFPHAGNAGEFDAFWDRAVETGFVSTAVQATNAKPFSFSALENLPKISTPAGLSMVLYPKVAMLDGRFAENPWLQELPDPISKVAWDNYACFSPAAAQRLGVQEGDVVRLETTTEGGATTSTELPAFLQPGQHDQVVAVALGYGRQGTERFANAGPKWLFARSGVGADGRVGKNAAPFVTLRDGYLQYVRGGIRVTSTGRRSALASTQGHHSLTMPKDLPLVGGQHRDIVRETTLPALLAGDFKAAPSPAKINGLWPTDHPYTGHRWAMAIDLTACTGCSGCVVACQAENNIPVVGKDEVLRHREMHWMRIDRYYAGEDEVDVVHQPMLCQQCDNAPCETVCPVIATVHSAEGLNQQIYNRCVGTRYCANNCPYKTRRFNWFNYMREDALQNLALNPDVTVRSRGIMEKCSFCVQRIEAARIEARRSDKLIADGQIQTACQQSCPAQAIVFGDLNDPSSRISKMVQGPRRFAVLEEFNFRPAVNYLAVVRNRDASGKSPSEDRSNG